MRSSRNSSIRLGLMFLLGFFFRFLFLFFVFVLVCWFFSVVSFSVCQSNGLFFLSFFFIPSSFFVSWVPQLYLWGSLFLGEIFA